jgi:putative ABC transport system permease protein
MLSALGIAIGVMSISLIVATGEIAQTYISTFLTKSVGKPTAINIVAGTNPRTNVAKITYNDYLYFETIKDKYPIEDTMPVLSFAASIKNTFEENIDQTIRGVGTSFQNLGSGNKNLQNIEGRFFSQSEYDNGESVIVITKQMAKDVKGKETLLGERIELGQKSFLVIGEYEGSVTLTSNGREVLMPITTAWKLRGDKDKTLQAIVYSVQLEKQVDYVSEAALDEINSYRSKNFSGDSARELSNVTPSSIMSTIGSVLLAFQAFLGLVAVISLLVGGIGVLNVMLMAVAQRIKEIGIRKAFGAKNKDILILFLSESIALTALSGLFGAMIAQFLVFLLVAAANYINPDLDLVAQYSWFGIYIAFLISCLIGVGFGLYPAYKAGKMSVVDALKYD